MLSDIAEYDPNAVHSENAYTYVEPRLYSNIAKMVQRTCPVSFDNILYNPEFFQEEKSETDKTTVNNFASSTMNDRDNKQETQPPYREELEQALKIERPMANMSVDMTPQLAHKQEMNLLDSALYVAENSDTKNSAVSTVQKKTRDSGIEEQYQDEGNSVYEELDKTAMDDFASNNKSKPFPLPVTAPKPKVKTSHIAPDSYKKMGTPPALPGRKPATGQQRHFQENLVKTAIYSNDIPRGQISPTMRKAHVSVEKTNSLENETVVCELKSSEDVEKLTIQEIATYLKKLKLEKYIDTFKDQLIDGRMLISLDKDILKEEFGMSAIEALRLMNFSQDGHIPT